MIPRVFLAVEEQIQGGIEVYNEGARQWRDFFAAELQQFLVPDLDPLGQTHHRSLPRQRPPGRLPPTDPPPHVPRRRHVMTVVSDQL